MFFGGSLVDWTDTDDESELGGLRAPEPLGLLIKSLEEPATGKRTVDPERERLYGRSVSESDGSHKIKTRLDF